MKMEEGKIFERFRKIKAKLGEGDFAVIDGKKYLTHSGWAKIKILFGLSHEIKEAQRIELEEGGGKKKYVWRYRIRVSSPDGMYSEAEGVCSSDERFVEGKDEFFISLLAQKRAFNRAVSLLVGGGETSAEELEGFFMSTRKVRTAQPQTGEVSAEEVEEWEERERKLETEMNLYSSAMEGDGSEEVQKSFEEDEVYYEEVEEDLPAGSRRTEAKAHEPETGRKMEPLTRRELLDRMKSYMSELGLTTPEEKREFVSRILGKKVNRSAELSDEELRFILSRLKAEIAKRKLR